MKRILLSLFGVLLGMGLSAQLLYQYTIAPSSPADVDSIKVKFIVILPWTGGFKQSSNLVLHDDTIHYTGCYYTGANGQSETLLPDSFMVSPLTAGTYHLVVTVLRSPDPDDPACDSLGNFPVRTYDSLLVISKATSIYDTHIGGFDVSLIDFSRLRLYVPQVSTVTVRVLNAAGRQCYSVQKPLTDGNNEIALDMPNLPSGIYIYYIQLGEQHKVLKYVKQ